MPSPIAIVIFVIVILVAWAVIARLRSNTNDEALPAWLNQNRPSPPKLTSFRVDEPAGGVPSRRPTRPPAASPPPPPLPVLRQPDQAPSPPPHHPSPASSEVDQEALKRYLSDKPSLPAAEDQQTKVMKPDYAVHKAEPEIKHFLVQPVSKSFRVPWIVPIAWLLAAAFAGVTGMTMKLPVSQDVAVSAGQLPKKPKLRSADRDNPTAVSRYKRRMVQYRAEYAEKKYDLDHKPLWIIILATPIVLFFVYKVADAYMDESRRKREMSEVADVVAEAVARASERRSRR